MDILALISFLAELLVIILAAAMGMKKKTYGWLFAVSYALFFVGDAADYLNVAVDASIINLVLLVGALFSLAAIWQLYKEK